MTNYRYLGYGVTDSNGVAKLDHDANGDPLSHSYTGVGAGEVDVVASLDNPIVDGSIVSVPCNVLDCYKYDSGTDPNNNIWTVAQCTLTRGTEYSTVQETTIGTTGVLSFANIPYTDYRVEFDVFQVDGTQNEWCCVLMKNDYSSIRSADATLNEWKHISMNITNQEVNNRIRLATGGSMTEMRFKNFKLYPI